jgi:outer membrane protein
LYFLIRLNSGQKNILSANIERLDRLLKITESQLESGLLRKIDLERVKVNRENLLTGLDNLNVLYEQQLELLKYAAGITQSRKIILTDSLDFSLAGIDILSDTVKNMRPELLILEKQKDFALINQKLAASGFYPSLSMYGQFYYQSQRDAFDFLNAGKDKWFNVGLIGLSLDVPIFNGFEKRAKINVARIDFEQASANYDFTHRYYSIEYQNAAKTYRNSSETVVRQNDNTKLAEKVYEQSLKQYQQGVTSLSDLLNAESNLDESHQSLLNALFQLRTAELDMLKASGKLRSILNL